MMNTEIRNGFDYAQPKTAFPGNTFRETRDFERRWKARPNEDNMPTTPSVPQSAEDSLIRAFYEHVSPRDKPYKPLFDEEMVTVREARKIRYFHSRWVKNPDKKFLVRWNGEEFLLETYNWHVTPGLGASRRHRIIHRPGADYPQFYRQRDELEYIYP